MKVVALVSGGKDSCYSMLLCQSHGHEVVALANLLPLQPDVDDLDSYMYQTVGHQVVASYAACTGLPLFRRRILGYSKEQGLVYEHSTHGDEVGDLLALLAFVKQAVPGVRAVCSGAIASDYQRTRVEWACARLGLVSLAYMWRQPQALLLQRMIVAGVDAVLVKIAAAGLRPDRHLGASLSAMQPQLHALHRLYGINVCGEGGEYETLTLDCPLFTRGSLVLDAWEAVVSSLDSMAPVALLHPTLTHIQTKPAAGQGSSVDESEASLLPAGEVIEVPDDYVAPAPEEPAVDVEAAAAADACEARVELRTTRGSAYVSVAAVVAGDVAAYDSAGATAAALTAALRRVDGALPLLGLSWAGSVFVHLYVPRMAHFAAANDAYSRFLPAVNPPARATVQLAANGEMALVAEVLLARPSPALQRRVLHVQSVSEWAPSCIGPYSQALSHRGLLHFAGQIPLDPGSMTILPSCSGAAAQCARSLRSCQAVAVAMRTDLPRSVLWCTVYCAEAAGGDGRAAAERCLRAFLRGELALLEADAAESPRGGGAVSGGGAASEGDVEEDIELADEYLTPPVMSRHWEPLLTFVTVPELPRGALLEIQPTAWAEDQAAVEASSSDSDDDAEGGKRLQQAPPGSKLPAWVQHMRSERSSRRMDGAVVHLSSLTSTGVMARLHATVEHSSSGCLESAALLPAMLAAAEMMRCSLVDAGLEAEDVASAKLYYRAEVMGWAKPGMRSVAAAVAVALGESVQPALVPVSDVGPGAAGGAALLFELLAVRGK